MHFLYYLKQNRLVAWFFQAFPNLYQSLKPVTSIQLELSSKCNLKCPFCIQSKVDNYGEHMPYEAAAEYIKKLPVTVKTIHLHFSGESFANPDIEAIVNHASQNTKAWLTVSTNGTFPASRYLDAIQSGLNEIIFAIDGASPETHEKYRIGSSLGKIKETLRAVVAFKKMHNLSVRVGVQFLVTGFNEDELEAMKVFCKSAGVDFLRLKTLSLDITGNGSTDAALLQNAKDYLPKNPAFSRYEIAGNRIRLKHPIVICPFVFNPVIGSNGDVHLCCIDIGKNISVGNLRDYSSFDALWKSKKYISLRKAVLKKELDICKNCNYCLTGGEEVTFA